MPNNKIYDLHMHTAFSADSEADPEEEIKQAIKLGLSGMCFTDHNDFGYKSPDGNDRFTLDFEKYLETMLPLKEKYSDKIQLRVGLEQGLTIPAKELIENYDPDRKLDFIIGSTHVVDGIDPYYPEYWAQYDVKTGIKHYFENIYDEVNELNNYDIYGHLDYICRYIPDEQIKKDPRDYLPMDLISEILKIIIDKGKGIELNTAGLRRGLFTNPCDRILNEYYRLGGEIITVGSDAHYVEHVGCDVPYAFKILAETGFTHIAFFTSRKPEFIPII